MASAVRDLALRHFDTSRLVLEQVLHDESLLATLERIADLTAQAMLGGRKLMVAGNGGSAADSQHLVAEFVSRLTVDRPAMRAVALTTDSSILTAIGNDYGYDLVFARQIEALGQDGDVFIGITTSGNSPNIVKALEQTKPAGITTLALTGNGGGKVAQLADYSIVVPSAVTAHIQESHLVIEHVFCMLVERCYFGMSYFGETQDKELTKQWKR
jgi:D-sedoheptulose 7-phosphate isomerase